MGAASSGDDGAGGDLASKCAAAALLVSSGGIEDGQHLGQHMGKKRVLKSQWLLTLLGKVEAVASEEQKQGEGPKSAALDSSEEELELEKVEIDFMVEESLRPEHESMLIKL